MPEQLTDAVGVERGSPDWSAVAHLEAQLARADALDRDFGVYITRTDETARGAAHDVDAAAARGELRTALAGMTIAVKDLLGTYDAPTTAQSLVHERDWFDGRDAPVVARLREAGAIVTGKTSMAEHAAGRIDPAKPFPVPGNPWDATRWPGGSSSGSAIAVALGLVDAALGTDTTGSLRIPAAFCGITGFRPSTGLVDTAGCIPASLTLDVVGPMAKSARDCATVLSAIAPTGEPDWRDSLDGVRVGVPWALLNGWGDLLDSDIRAAFERAVEELRSGGAEIVDIELPEWDVLTAATMLITAKEMFLGHAANLASRWKDYGRSFRRIAVVGALIPPDKLYEQLHGLESAKASLLARFTEFDIVALPSWAQPPASYFEKVEMGGGELNLTAAWAAAGLPCVATPMGIDSRGLPMSLQLAGMPGDDLRVLEIADFFERSTATPLPEVPAWSGGFQPVPDPDEGQQLLPDAEQEALANIFAQLGIRPDAHDLAAIQSMLKTFGA